MGLDMYLTKRVYIGANYEHNKVTGTIDLQKDGKPIKINLNKVSYIEEAAAYWRKANQIHNWFVQNVQDGNDDCKDYDVSKEQLIELVNLCKKVLELATTVDGQVHTGETWSSKEGHTHHYEPGKVIVNQDKIEELLPTQSGFFFGGTDYDEYYLQDLKDTIDQLQPLIDEEGYYDYQYCASW